MPWTYHWQWWQEIMGEGQRQVRGLMHRLEGRVINIAYGARALSSSEGSRMPTILIKLAKIGVADHDGECRSWRGFRQARASSVPLSVSSTPAP